MSETTPSETCGEPVAERRDGAEVSASDLYATWKREVLTGSPVESSAMEEVTKTSPKRARGSSLERRAPGSGSSRSACSTSDEHTDSELSMSAISDSAKPARRLVPWPPKGGKGRGGGKGKKGGKGRGRGRR